jgi:hypothetical protein
MAHLRKGKCLKKPENLPQNGKADASRYKQITCRFSSNSFFFALK